jgi:predicted transcriptional regulator
MSDDNRITVRVDRSTRNRIREVARDTNRNASRVVREALSEYFVRSRSSRDSDQKPSG